jgi:hypothetical protein
LPNSSSNSANNLAELLICAFASGVYDTRWEERVARGLGAFVIGKSVTDQFPGWRNFH